MRRMLLSLLALGFIGWFSVGPPASPAAAGISLYGDNCPEGATAVPGGDCICPSGSTYHKDANTCVEDPHCPDGPSSTDTGLTWSGSAEWGTSPTGESQVSNQQGSGYQWGSYDTPTGSDHALGCKKKNANVNTTTRAWPPTGMQQGQGQGQTSAGSQAVTPLQPLRGSAPDRTRDRCMAIAADGKVAADEAAFWARLNCRQYYNR